MQNTERKRRERLKRLQKACVLAVLLLAGVYYLLLGREQEGEELRYRSLSIEETVQSGMGQSGQAISGDALGQSGEEAYPQAQVAAGDVSGLDAIGDGLGQPDPADSGDVPGQADAEIAVPKQTEADDGRVNINTASMEELETLPGIGPATAQLIIEYRESYGGFAEIAEIQNVKRIGEKTFEKIRDQIKV